MLPWVHYKLCGASDKDRLPVLIDYERLGAFISFRPDVKLRNTICCIHRQQSPIRLRVHLSLQQSRTTDLNLAGPVLDALPSRWMAKPQVKVLRLSEHTLLFAHNLEALQSQHRGSSY